MLSKLNFLLQRIKKKLKGTLTFSVNLSRTNRLSWQLKNHTGINNPLLHDPERTYKH